MMNDTGRPLTSESDTLLQSASVWFSTIAQPWRYAELLSPSSNR